MLSCSSIRSDVYLCGDVCSYSVSSYVIELLMLASRLLVDVVEMLPTSCWSHVTHGVTHGATHATHATDATDATDGIHVTPRVGLYSSRCWCSYAVGLYLVLVSSCCSRSLCWAVPLLCISVV